MTPTTSTHGPESDDGRQGAPGAMDAATEAREALDLDAIEAQARHWDHLIRDDPDTTLALVRELREARADVERLLGAIEEQDWQRWQERAEAAEAERDDLRARLARWDGHRCWSGTEGVNSAGPRKRGPNTAGPR